ncbi:MAG: O-antigen ligase family protein [Acidobacteriota bacterium]
MRRRHGHRDPDLLPATLLALVLLALLIPLYPLPFAAMHSWARHAMRLLIVILAAAWFSSPEARLGERLERPAPRALLWLLPLFGLMVILAVRIFLQPAGARPHPLNPGPAGDALIEIVESTLLAIVAFALLDGHRGRIVASANLLIASGCFQAIYGLTQFFSKANAIFGVPNLRNKDVAFGSFVNPDHFSAYLEMALPLCIGMIVSRRPGVEQFETLKEKIIAFSQESFQKSILYVLAALIMALGIVFSKCRSGFIVLLASLFIITALGGSSRSAPAARRWVAGFLVLFCLAGLWVSYDPLYSKFVRATRDRSLESRVDIWRTSIEIVREYPWFGVGPGVMGSIYPRFERTDAGARMDFAHQVYIQIAVEYGLMGLALWLVLAFYFTARLYGRWRERHHPFARGIGAGCLVGIFAMYLHGLTDFALSIPANAFTFLILYCMGFAAVRYKRR